tara:strand:+ start:352 stop:459 length:108 start_codon:yes stop_codon:yes gene_type:complete
MKNRKRKNLITLAILLLIVFSLYFWTMLKANILGV